MMSPEVPTTNQICPSYFQQGYCLRGANCQYQHDGDAINVPEFEFLYTWQVGEVLIDQCKFK